MFFRISFLVCLLGGLLEVSGAELTSENNFKLKAVYGALPRTDGNGDGILSLDELKTYVRDKFNDQATSQFNPYLSRFLKGEPLADKNCDGVLTKDELLTHLHEQGEHYAALQNLTSR